MDNLGRKGEGEERERCREDGQQRGANLLIPSHPLACLHAVAAAVAAAAPATAAAAAVPRQLQWNPFRKSCLASSLPDAAAAVAVAAAAESVPWPAPLPVPQPGHRYSRRRCSRRRFTLTRGQRDDCCCCSCICSLPYLSLSSCFPPSFGPSLHDIMIITLMIARSTQPFTSLFPSFSSPIPDPRSPIPPSISFSLSLSALVSLSLRYMLLLLILRSSRVHLFPVFLVSVRLSHAHALDCTSESPFSSSNSRRMTSCSTTMAMH